MTTKLHASVSPFFAILALAASTFAQPAIRTSNGILNASGYQPQLAPDTVFVIFGTGMGPATIQTAAASGYQQSLAGTSINFTPAAGGAGIPAQIVYTVATQVAGLLPSSIAPGTYAVTVSYQNQTSPPQNVQVVPRSLGIATANSAGTGAAQASIGNVNNSISLVRMTSGSISFNGYDWTLSPAHPGDEIVLWGTGGGADPANDTGGSSGDQTAAGNFTVNVDGTSIVPLYSGTSSGYPGLWQVNFVLPSNITADCLASVTVSGGGVQSNAVNIAIAAAGQTSCSTTIPASTLAQLDSGSGTITYVGLGVSQQIQNGASTNTFGGLINRYTVTEFLAPYNGPKFDKCVVFQEAYTGTDPVAASAQLDAGTVTLSAPGGQSIVAGKISGANGPIYNGSFTPVPGTTYTLTATGGSQVAPFTTSTAFPSSFTVTNLNSLSTINRSQPLTVSWTGSGFDHVAITIQTENIGKTVQSVVVNCTLPASLGTYTIPAAALAYLLPSATNSTFRIQSENNTGMPASAYNNMDPNSAVSLVGGGLVNFGIFGPTIDYLLTPVVQ